MPHKKFPAAVPTTRLGELSLSEDRWSRFVWRHYEAQSQPRVFGESVRVIVWPPKRGVSNPASLGTFVDHTFDQILGALATKTLFTRAEHLVAEAISSFTEPFDGYTPPTASRLLNSVRLEMIKINAKGDHEIQFFDWEELVGGHDLLIGLNRELEAAYAHFDG